jgi:hypothetical protein
MSSWEAALKLTEEDLEKTLKRGQQLRRAIRMLKQNIKDEIPFPEIEVKPDADHP